MKFKKYCFLSGYFLALGFFPFAAICQTNFNTARQLSFLSPQIAIASADLNKDGIADLVTGGDPIGSESGKIYVLLGKGNGNFHSPHDYLVGFSPNYSSARYVQKIEIADMNNDGSLDVVVAHNGTRDFFNFSSLFVTVLFGNGNGGLTTTNAYRFITLDSDFFVTAISIADLNSDGLPDVVVGCRTRSLGQIYLMKNLGDGSFQTMGPRAVISSVVGIATGFYNNDKFIDVVSSSRQGVTLWYGNGNFDFPNGAILQDREDLGDLVSDDLNLDGKEDFVVGDFLSRRVRVFIQGEEGFPDAPAFYETAVNPHSLKSADINGDGTKDLLIGDGSSGGVQLFIGTGKGEFTSSNTIESGVIADLSTADFDRNGKLDIAVANFDISSTIQARLFLNSPNTGRYYTDFDGDSKADFTVYRRSTGMWRSILSIDDSFRGVRLGRKTDQLVSGNYDGDDKADFAIYRHGTWSIHHSSDGMLNTHVWGQIGDIPVPADYDNDGKMDIAVFRPSNGHWYIKKDLGYDEIVWGMSTDKPTPADYDGDGRTDIAVYRALEGVWYILQSRTGDLKTVQFGSHDDHPIPADFDGDGMADIAVFRSLDASWYILRSSDGHYATYIWGGNGDLPVPNDYDGDGKTDIGVFRPSNGTWYYLRSSDNSSGIKNWGVAGDIPVSVNLRPMTY